MLHVGNYHISDSDKLLVIMEEYKKRSWTKGSSPYIVVFY